MGEISMAEEQKKEGKGYIYEFYHEIGMKGGETLKKRHGRESHEEVQKEHQEGKP